MTKPAIKYWTETNIGKLRPPADAKADHTIWHPEIAGLGIRFRNGGAGTFSVTYWNGQDDRRMSIGKVGAVTLKFAEDEAKRIQGMTAGTTIVDPLVERAKAKTDLAAPMRELIEQFLQAQHDKGRAKGYVNTQDSHLNIYFAGLHTIPIRLIDKATVIRELDKIKKERGKISMTRARATLSKFFNWGQRRDLCDHNPVSFTEKHESIPRDRVLQPKELAVIWQEAGDDEYGRIVRLLMLTAARRTQIGGLRKHELEEDDALITLGGQIGIREAKRLAKLGDVEDESLSKNRHTFLIPLSRQALAVFAQQPDRKDSRHVFGDGGEGGYSGWSKAMDDLKARIGDRVKADWGFHDFRRSFETLGQDLVKIPENITDRCINHIPQTKKGTRKHYNFAEHLDARIEAMQAWGDFIEATVAKYAPKAKLKLVKAA